MVSLQQNAQVNMLTKAFKPSNKSITRLQIAQNRIQINQNKKSQ